MSHIANKFQQEINLTNMSTSFENLTKLQEKQSSGKHIPKLFSFKQYTNYLTLLSVYITAPKSLSGNVVEK